jgi:LPS-assembly lipoprotein
MSSAKAPAHRGSSPLVRRVALAVGLAAMSLGLGGCLQPLYGPGLGTSEALGAIDVAPIPGRLGHFIATDLQFGLAGGALPETPLYRLDVKATPTTRVAIVDRYLANADSASIYVTATYTLTRLSDNLVIDNGSVSGSASYDRVDQRFATLQAQRNAEERVARLVGEQIRTRLAASFASGAARAP